MTHTIGLLCAFSAVLIAGCGGASTPAHSPNATTESPMPSTVQSPDVSAETKKRATSKTVLDLNDVVRNPTHFEWFNFKPNLDKLILAGTPETEHIALLWYTIPDGKVGLHYHSKTESVYVIEGTQTDAKGSYPNGTVYFNPPGSGHQIHDSTGFFILAYASPPDFKSTDLIGEYAPVRIDTNAENLLTAYPFVEVGAGVRTYSVPLDTAGGMSATLLALQGAGAKFSYEGNYVLVLKGNCSLDDKTLGERYLAVTKTTSSERFELLSNAPNSCLALGLSFTSSSP